MKRLFDRRQILNWLLGGSTFAWVGSVIYPVLRFLSPPPEQEAAVSAVKAATLEGLHEVAEQNGLSDVKEKEHTYFDEFDIVASQQDSI